MATYDLNTKDVLGTGATTISALRSESFEAKARKIEAYLDIAKITAAGWAQADGDIFQLLKVPAGSLVVSAGAEVMTAFDGTTPTVNIDFAAGDDIVDGGDVTSTGYLASGTNGAANEVGVSTLAAEFIATEDTIDVTLIAGSADCTVGVLRVYAVVVEMGEHGGQVPTEVVRDQLA